MLSKNHSYFFIPFKVNNIERWRYHLEERRYTTNNGKIIQVWEKISKRVPVHLMQHVIDGVGYQTERHYAYKLVDKRAYGLPYSDKNKKLLTCIMRYRGMNREFLIDICNVNVHCFESQVGFLVYDIWYSKEMTENDILEFNYLFKKVGLTNLSFKDAVPLDTFEEKTYLYQLSQNMIGNGYNDEAELFFNCLNPVRMECNVFSVYCVNEALEDTERMLFYLCHSYTEDYGYDLPMGDAGYLAYYPYSYIHWGYCQDGIACIYSDINEFTQYNLQGKLANDYYFMYLILLHQRYVILLLIDKMMKFKEEDVQKWKEIRQDLIQYRMVYSYIVVSDEMPYHKIYKDMREALSIDVFENDLNDISDRMYAIRKEEQNEIEERQRKKEEADDDYRNWRLEIGLGVLSLLAVFSALVDSITIINLWFFQGKSYSCFTWIHWIAYLLIAFITIIVIWTLVGSCLKYRRKRKDNRKNGRNI